MKDREVTGLVGMISPDPGPCVMMIPLRKDSWQSTRQLKPCFQEWRGKNCHWRYRKSSQEPSAGSRHFREPRRALSSKEHSLEVRG